MFCSHFFKANNNNKIFTDVACSMNRQLPNNYMFGNICILDQIFQLSVSVFLFYCWSPVGGWARGTEQNKNDEAENQENFLKQAMKEVEATKIFYS